DASAATGPAVTFTGTAGSVVPASSLLNRTNGTQYTLDSAVTIGAGGTGSGSVTAVLPDSDSTLTAADGNADAGTTLALDTAVAGVDSTVTAAQAITGGAVMETQDTFRSRVL